MQHLLFLTLALVVVSLAAPATHAQLTDPDFEDGVFEVMAPRLSMSPITLLVGVDGAGQIYLPLLEVLAYLGIPAAAVGDTIELEWPPPEWTTRIDARTGEVNTPEQTHFLGDDLAIRDGDVFLAVPAVARVLGARSSASWETLSIVLSYPGGFPAERQIEIYRERIRASRAPTDRPDTVAVPFRSQTGGRAVDWGFSHSLAGAVARMTAFSAVGVSVLGGGLEAGGSLAAIDREVLLGSDPFIRYHRQFPGNAWLQQLELGHLHGDGPLPLQLFGVRVSNEPGVQPRYLGSTVVQPHVPAGWEYEVYEGSHLVGVGSGEAGAGVDTPIRYGATPLSIRMIGPAGQERTEQLTVLVPVTRVPAGSWRYYAGGGSCAFAACGSYAYGELRHGLHPRLSLGVGADYLDSPAVGADAGARPYVTLSASPTWSLTTDVQARLGSFVRASLQHYSAQGRSTGARLLWGHGDSSIGGFAGWRVDGWGQFALPDLLGGSPTSVSLALRGDTTGVRQVVSSITVPVSRGLVILEHDQSLQGASLTTARLFQTLTADIPGMARTPIATSLSVGVSHFELAHIDFSATFSPLAVASVSTGVRWRPGGSPVFNLSYRHRLSAAHVQSRVTADARGAVTFASLQGGAAYDEEHGLSTSPYRVVGRAGLGGHVFLDREGSGAFTPGVDTPIPGIEIRAGGRRAVSDSDGRFRIWGLAPYEVAVITEDAIELADPEFGMRESYLLLRPPPNMFSEVEIPIVRTRELSGVLLQGAGVRSVGGLVIEVENLQTGRLTTLRTFRDGEYYLARLLPGDYEIRVAETSLRAIGALAMPATLTVHVPAESDALTIIVEPIRIELPGDAE